jgi:hypothetical protein
MMRFVLTFGLLAGFLPLWRLWQTARGTTLTAAVAWANAAWLAWIGAFLIPEGQGLPADISGRYVALALTGCAGVAVLGARRPGAGPWNFVVLALLALDLIPLARTLAGISSLNGDGLLLSCLAGTITVGALNYLPTRAALSALAVLAGSALTMGDLLFPGKLPGVRAGELCIALAPWLALIGSWIGEQAGSPADREWRRFRDLFGFVWAERVREQFNRSTEHARSPMRLHWGGLASLEPQQQGEALKTLEALTKRFRRSEPEA